MLVTAVEGNPGVYMYIYGPTELCLRSHLTVWVCRFPPPQPFNYTPTLPHHDPPTNSSHHDPPLRQPTSLPSTLLASSNKLLVICTLTSSCATFQICLTQQPLTGFSVSLGLVFRLSKHPGIWSKTKTRQARANGINYRCSRRQPTVNERRS